MSDHEGRPYIEERTYLPTGCPPDHYESRAFQVVVAYRGAGRWAVVRSREAHQQMTHTGRWLWLPSKMTALKWCRFSFEQACALAEAHVDRVSVNGRTWAEWEQWREARASSGRAAVTIQ